MHLLIQVAKFKHALKKTIFCSNFDAFCTPNEWRVQCTEQQWAGVNPCRPLVWIR